MLTIVVQIDVKYDWPTFRPLRSATVSNLLLDLSSLNSCFIFSPINLSSSLTTQINLFISLRSILFDKFAFWISIIISDEWPPDPNKTMTSAIENKISLTMVQLDANESSTDSPDGLEMVVLDWYIGWGCIGIKYRVPHCMTLKFDWENGLNQKDLFPRS